SEGQPDYHSDRQERHDGERRRPRRGRRGGRGRNRQDRNDQDRNGQDRDHQDRDHDAPMPQSDVMPDAGDYSAPPMDEPEQLRDRAESAPPAPRPGTTETSTPSPAPEQPRRRSTVREPAPVSNGESFTPSSPAPQATTPEPAETTEAEDPNRPRKTGWW